MILNPISPPSFDYLSEACSQAPACISMPPPNLPSIHIGSSPFVTAAEYYGRSHTRGKTARTRDLSVHSRRVARSPDESRTISRRASHDDLPSTPRTFVIRVKETLKQLLESEDTDSNMMITVEDTGPKVLSVGTARSAGTKSFELRGTYVLSNLLQELTLAQEHGRKTVVLDEARLNENPVDRLSRLIRDSFWPALTRTIDGSNIASVARDVKDWTPNPRPRIYVPEGEPEMYEYYCKIAEEQPESNLDVRWLRRDCGDPEYIRDLNDAPGLLALAMTKEIDRDTGKLTMKGVPYVVPGGRFNELYGWDSYMESLGLIKNGRVDLAKGMVINFCFCIQHYGKILNANRSYYLNRSQPPFLTDMALRVYNEIRHEPGAREFLRESILAAIKEYYSVWCCAPRYDPLTGLSRYRPDGLGVPPEPEEGHFDHLLRPYAEKYNMTIPEFTRAFNYRQVSEPALDEYFLHDRAVRESGHDTSYRLDDVCADLATVDLNSLLYKYETDIARVIREHFNENLPIPAAFKVPGKPDVECSAAWDRRARARRAAMIKYMWSDEDGMFFDYNTITRKRTDFESATTLWPMWSGVATPHQASQLVLKALPKLEFIGGLVSGTEKSRGLISPERPMRQWDYPFGWAPHQIIAWIGLERYGFGDDARRLAYKWCFMVTKAFVDFNGIVVEKYDVTTLQGSHRVDAEYGNQGSEVQGVAREGFGWVNASYVVGMSLMTKHMKRALGAVTPYPTFVKATEEPHVFF